MESFFGEFIKEWKIELCEKWKLSKAIVAVEESADRYQCEEKSNEIAKSRCKERHRSMEKN